MFEQVIERIRAGQHFLVACHRRPDADSLGSALGLIATLRAFGKEATLFMPEEVPPLLHFLLEGETPISSCDDGIRYDATFIMDIAATALLPPEFPASEVTGPLIVIDHHHAHDRLGDIVVRDTSASATGEVVLALIDRLGLDEIPAGAATPLYAAIVSDTGGFRYSSTSAATLRLGARLVEAGADPWQVAQQIFEIWEPSRLRLLAAILATLELDFDGRVAILRVTRQMMADCGATDDDVEGMVNYARRVKGAEIGALLWEFPTKDGDGLDTKISLRSGKGADVSELAQELGGGGHRAAAATQLHISLEEAAERLRAALAKRFR